MGGHNIKGLEDQPNIINPFKVKERL